MWLGAILEDNEVLDNLSCILMTGKKASKIHKLSKNEINVLLRK